MHYEHTHYIWICLMLTLSLHIDVIIQHSRCIIKHYKYVHNALYMDALSVTSN